jgi:peptidoglycan hydrolase-like protein with peptidoglycan-binding domain
VKRSLLTLTALALCISARGDENITEAQARLQAEGLYHGNSTGNYDSETAAAVTRYQIRHGLAITGKLDAATSKELGIPAPESEAPPKVLSGSWRRLRSGEMQFVEQPSSPNSTAVAQPSSAKSSSAPTSARSTPPTKLASGARNRLPSASISAEDKLSEAMRSYVAAFILAGLDPHIGSELEFFGPNVDYFGSRNVPRKQIERDLVRYDRQWPERQFWLDGDIRVRRRTPTSIEFDFPLRYELRNGSKHASGKVIKSLSLIADADNEMQIIAVDERKAP